MSDRRIYLSEVDFTRLHELSDEDLAEVDRMVRASEEARRKLPLRLRTPSTDVANRGHLVLAETQRRAREAS